MPAETHRLGADLIEVLKTALRPIVRHRTLLERAKFIGTEVLDPQSGNDLIGEWLAAGEARALGKMGGVEVGGLCRYESAKDSDGLCTRWGRHRSTLQMNAGVYPNDDQSLSRFAPVYSRALGDMDLLAVWYQQGERRLLNRYAPRARLASLTALEPFYHHRPWSRHLSSKRVLVISPFAATIQSQYERRAEVWRSHPEVLPAFRLDTLCCPLSAGLQPPLYPDWFAALAALQSQMDRRSYDVLIVGAGAWSLPLVTHAKRRGKWAIHLGGGTQILFGVRGGRWDNEPFFQTAINEAWVRPNAAERPQSFRKIENGCYW